MTHEYFAYTISRKFAVCRVCYDLVSVDFTHIIQDPFTGTTAMALLPMGQLKEYGQN